jgi:hypothetical protein
MRETLGIYAGHSFLSLIVLPLGSRSHEVECCVASRACLDRGSLGTYFIEPLSPLSRESESGISMQVSRVDLHARWRRRRVHPSLVKCTPGECDYAERV